MSEAEEQEATAALCAAFAVILRPWARGEAEAGAQLLR